jgi:hypothetical protein
MDSFTPFLLPIALRRSAAVAQRLDSLVVSPVSSGLTGCGGCDGSWGMGMSRMCMGISSTCHQHNHGKSPFLLGKSTISMAIFNSYVKLPEGSSKLY